MDSCIIPLSCFKCDNWINKFECFLVSSILYSLNVVFEDASTRCTSLTLTCKSTTGKKQWITSLCFVLYCYHVKSVAVFLVCCKHVGLLWLRLRETSSLSCVGLPSMEKMIRPGQKKERQCTPRTTRCWVSLWVSTTDWSFSCDTFKNRFLKMSC